MIENATNTEFLFIRKTAEEFRSKGYEVTLEPLLDFLPGFQPDLLVRKGEDVRVIEVKSRSSLAAEPRIRELAQTVDSKPGWTFDLILVGESEILDSPDGAQSFEREATLLRIQEAEQVLVAGYAEAAFLLAWSACEAAMRELLAAEGVSNPSITRPGYVLDQAVYVGVISRRDYNALTEMETYRNAIVHGFSVSDFSEELVSNLIETIRRIVKTEAPVGVDSDQVS